MTDVPEIRGETPLRSPDVGRKASSALQLAYARAQKADSALSRLTPRQLNVLQLIASGYRTKEIALIVGIKERTVDMHRAAILDRLGARSSPEATAVLVEASFLGAVAPRERSEVL